MAEQGRSLSNMFQAGAVKPYIGARYRFEEIPDALLRLKAGQIPGKAVVDVTRNSGREA